jgi:hypothetical protein
LQEQSVSAEIINLNKVRKAKVRAEKERSAAANRTRFGRSKADRQAEELERDRARRELDGARREDDETEPK